MERLATRYVVVAGERQYLDPTSYAQRRVRFVDGGEQCEDCGRDLADARLMRSPGRDRVICECGCAYTVHQH